MDRYLSLGPIGMEVSPYRALLPHEFAPRSFMIHKFKVLHDIVFILAKCVVVELRMKEFNRVLDYEKSSISLILFFSNIDTRVVCFDVPDSGIYDAFSPQTRIV